LKTALKTCSRRCEPCQPRAIGKGLIGLIVSRLARFTWITFATH
jgi:hypothetical protein